MQHANAAVNEVFPPAFFRKGERVATMLHEA
jgi:hypothetical protein